MQQNSHDHTRLDRRDFLRLAGATAMASLATAALPGEAAAGKKGFTVPQGGDRGFWKKVQNAFVLDRRQVYMNIGTTGSTPRHVLDNYDRYNRLVAKDPWDMGGEWGSWPYTSGLVSDVAPGFGADPDELVLSRNTTDGMCTIIGGLALEPGDQVLTTHHEHIAAISPLTIMAERYGVEVKYLEIPVFPESDDEFVDLFAANITPRTRFIVFSHVTYKTGTRLPAKKICQLARDHGIITLVDGAHTPGMIKLDFHDIGCDFYAGSGHKWQCGPGATGILYVKRDTPALDHYYPINASLYPYRDHFGITTQLQYVGNDNYPAKRALRDVCAMWDTIGREKIEAYVLSLSARCKEKIRERFGEDVLIFSPDVPELASGLTTFNPFSDPTDSNLVVTFRDRLREEYGYIIRYTNFKINLADSRDTYALRISTHLFHDEDQVDGLVDAMHHLYRRMTG